jgi:hypothetical protein
LSNDVPKATQLLEETASADEHAVGEETTSTGWRTRVFPVALAVVSLVVVVVLFGVVLLKSKAVVDSPR